MSSMSTEGPRHSHRIRLPLRSNETILEDLTMPKTPAQRQAAYRARRTSGEGDARINTWISSAAHHALRRLARRHGTTRREMLERLILDADQEILNFLEIDSPELERYLGVTQ